MGENVMLKNNRDELTGLLDKHAFYACSQEIINNSDDSSEYAFVFFDLENFKLFNANYGYEKGDELLKSIGSILQEVFKESLVARFSGDHFAVCTTSLHIVPAITEAREKVTSLQKNIKLELKAGVYVLDDETNDVIRCCDRARMACVSIKKKYDIDYKFYDEELGGTLTRKQFILDSLDEALENNYIKVYYQPIVRALTGEVYGWEALVRWINPDKSMVYPNEFISVLEEYRLIHKLDCYVMEQVVKHFSALKKEKPKEAVPVSINLSRIDFEVLDIVAFIDSLMEKYQAAKGMFRFEITESVLMDNPRFIQDQVKALKDNGYKVWMDDFGSGYSSLNILRNYDFDLVKIDMEFLRDFETSDEGKIVLKHMVSMLKNLGFHTLTEGVETKEQYDFLKGLGCELIQGYLIGRPLPYEEGIENIKNTKRRFENTVDRHFLSEIGRIDVLKQNPLEKLENSIVEGVLPLAIAIIEDGKWKYVYANNEYLQSLREMGHESLEMAEKRLNDESWQWTQRKQFWELCDLSKSTKEVETMEFVGKGRIISTRLRYISTDKQSKRDAYLISTRVVVNYVSDRDDNKNNAIGNYMFSFYESIDLFGMDKIHYENLYLENDRLHVKNRNKTCVEIIQDLAEQKVYKDDRKLFLEYMNLDKIRERLDSEPNGIKIALFRILNARDQYVWKTITLRMIHLYDDEMLLSCVSEASKEMASFMESYVLSEHKDNKFEQQLTYEVDKFAFENVLRLVPFGVFWKDKDRRFVGANQMFLDYYDLKSVDEIIGKTDEDMGWHIDPEPFMKDELEVINEGKVIKDVSGECIVKGKVRKITASKQPFIVNGETVGLIGFFNDVTEEVKEKQNLKTLCLTDQLTGLQNRRAYDDIIDKYETQYKKNKTDFVMIVTDIDNFKQINDRYSHDFGDLVLKKVSEVIKSVTSNNSVAFRIGGDEFVLLHQYSSKAEVESMVQEINIKIERIRKISKVDIKIRISTGTAYYSEVHDRRELYQVADKRMYEEKLAHKRG